MSSPRRSLSARLGAPRLAGPALAGSPPAAFPARKPDASDPTAGTAPSMAVGPRELAGRPALSILVWLLLCGLAVPGPAEAVTCPITGNAWKFIQDLNYPDGTPVSPGAVINKGWKLQNCGTTDWSGFKAVRVSGIYGPSQIPLPNAQSLEIFDLFQTMTVPTSPGLHKAEYKVATGTGFQLPESFWVEVLATGGTQFTLTVSKSGSGTVTSSPGGINCGGQCSADFAGGATVSLDANPSSGWVFAGWSGDGDCSDGVVVMNGDRSCQATFEPDAPGNPVLTVSTAGSGSGKVMGPGIDCGAGGSDCSQSFSPGTSISLNATPSAGSTFGGWSGDCNASGQVVMNGDRQCTATFTGGSGCTPTLNLSVSPTVLGLKEGWPDPNPVTVTLTASSSGSCSGDAMLRIGLPGDTPRFYAYEAGPTAGCQVSVDDPATFSTTSYLLNCPLSPGPGGSRTYDVKIWVQPSPGGTLDVSASWKGLSKSAGVSVPTAGIHPLALVHGIQGSQPPQNKVITGRSAARRVLDPFLGHYGPLLDNLQKMGYEWDKTLFAVAYDWRKSNVDSATFLRDSLSGTVIPNSNGLPYVEGDGKADLIVHSMGGLVTRAYVQGPDYAFDLGKVIFVATPHKGFPFTYRTWEGLTWGDYVGHAPFASGLAFQGILDKILWPSHVAKRYKPSAAELALSCVFKQALGSFLPAPYSGDVYIFTNNPPGFWVCSQEEIYDWSHSTDASRAIGSLPQMLPTEDMKDYLVDPIFGIPRPFGHQSNSWLTDLNADISTLESRLTLGNIYTIVGDKGKTDSWYRLEPPGYVVGSPLWKYGTVLPFWPFVQEEQIGDNLIPLWSTGLEASGLLNLPPGNEVVMDASKPCFGLTVVVCETAIHSPIMYQDDTQKKHVPRILAGVELPFKTDYWPPILEVPELSPGPILDRIFEILSLVTACPIDLFVVDPLGRRLGLDPGTGDIHREIAGGIYTETGIEPQAVLIPNPVPGTYQITVMGYGTGPYSVRVDRTGGDTATVAVFGGDITPGGTATVPVDLSPNAAPTASTGPDQVLSAGDQCTAAALLDGSGSSDPDGDTLTYAWTGPTGVLEGPNPTAVLPPGTHELTLTVHDGKGQVASDTVVITVEDTTPPALSVPAPVTVEQTSLTGTPVLLPPATATDNCGVPTVTSDAPAVFPLGTTTVTFTAVDLYGNTTTGTTTVTVVDTTPPVIANVPPPVTVEQATSAGTLVTLALPTASDICDVAPLLTTSHPTPAVFPLGATIITFTATDASGNVGTATTKVTVVDTQPPVLTNVPPPVTVEQTSHKGTPVPLPLPKATDICDAAPDVKSNAPAVFPLGTTKVTFIATDDSGNQAKASTTVTVVDTKPPVIQGITPSPDVLWPPNRAMRSVDLNVSVYDICDTKPFCKIASVSSSEPVTGPGDKTTPDWVITGNLTVGLRAERRGNGNGRVYTIQLRCADDSGNSSTRTTKVTVPHDQGH